MKLAVFLAFALLSAADISRAGSSSRRAPESDCAFADESLMTFMNVTVFAAEHYVARHRWPRSREELQIQARRFNPRGKTEELFARFSRLEIQQRGRDLRLEMCFRAGGKVYRRGVVLHPGKNTDEILHAATAPPMVREHV